MEGIWEGMVQAVFVFSSVPFIQGMCVYTAVKQNVIQILQFWKKPDEVNACAKRSSFLIRNLFFADVTDSFCCLVCKILSYILQCITNAQKKTMVG